MSEKRERRKRLLAALASVFSFRVLVALGLSTSVTAGVAGPLAAQVFEARAAQEEAVGPRPEPDGTTTTTTEAPAPTAPPTTAAPTTTIPTTLPTTTSTPPTTSTTSTTTTTTPGSTTVPVTTVPPTTTVAPSTTVPPIGPEGILVSSRPDRGNATLLHQSTIFGDSYFFFVDERATRVRFYLDDPDGRGTPASTVEGSSPFDFRSQRGEPVPVFADTLGNGQHTMLVVADTPDGEIRRLARFSVLLAPPG